MIGAIILTFVITSLTNLVIFLYNENRKKISEKNRLLKENDSLKRQIHDRNTWEQRSRENRAYDQGLYNGRETDALYRQCLKKYTNQEQPTVMIDGEKED